MKVETNLLQMNIQRHLTRMITKTNTKHLRVVLVGLHNLQREATVQILGLKQ